MRSMSKEQNKKKRDKARSLSHSALDYQSSLERLLADISIKLNSLHFRC